VADGDGQRNRDQSDPQKAAPRVALCVAAEEAARRAARMYGTPLYVWENGKVVAKRP